MKQPEIFNAVAYLRLGAEYLRMLSNFCDSTMFFDCIKEMKETADKLAETVADEKERETAKGVLRGNKQAHDGCTRAG